MESSLTERATWRDYYELCKPNVVWLMILTAIVGMCMATPGVVPVDVVIFASVGIALCAGSAAAINHLADQHVDAVMARTSGRPIVKGKIDSQGAAIFACVLGSLGMLVLLTWVNALTAWLTLASLVGYAFIYTLYLKRATPQNIVIGGLAGAMPPLLGWTAVTNQVDGHALLLVLIIFAWTPPHFWALAIARKEEYAKVEIPMVELTDVHLCSTPLSGRMPSLSYGLPKRISKPLAKGSSSTSGLSDHTLSGACQSGSSASSIIRMITPQICLRIVCLIHPCIQLHGSRSFRKIRTRHADLTSIRLDLA